MGGGFMNPAPVTTSEIQKREIISYLKNYIQKDHLQKDDKLPSENKIAAMFQVNRNTVRGALTVLKAQGIIYSQKGKGFFVSQKPNPIVFEHDNSLGFSEILNKGKREYTSAVLDIRQGLPTMRERKLLQLEENDTVYYLKQLRTKNGQHFAVCLSILPQKYVPGFEEHLDDFSGINNILLNAYHYPHPVCKWIQLTASLPQKEELELLNIAENTPIFKQENVFRIEGLGNIEYFIVRARGDSYRFTMEFE